MIKIFMKTVKISSVQSHPGFNVTKEVEIAQYAINYCGLEVLVRAPQILDTVPCQAGYQCKCYMYAIQRQDCTSS